MTVKYELWRKKKWVSTLNENAESEANKVGEYVYVRISDFPTYRAYDKMVFGNWRTCSQLVYRDRVSGFCRIDCSAGRPSPETLRAIEIEGHFDFTEMVCRELSLKRILYERVSG